MRTSLVLRQLNGEPGEMDALQRVIEAAPRYLYRITGHPPGAAEAQSLFTVLPEGKTYDDKFVYGVYQGDTMVGCADVIRAYPAPGSAWLGLLLIAEPFQRQGVGAAAYGLLEEQIRTWPVARIRLGVVRTNDEVLPFWRKQGFVETGEVKPYRCDKVISETVILQKVL